MSEVQYPPVREAMKKLEELSLSEEERFRAIARERALIDEASLRWEATEGKEEARREGRAEGRAKGRAEGLSEGRTEGRSLAKAETLARQLAHRFGPLSPAAQATISSATEAQLDTWLDGIFDATSVQALLQSRGH